MQKTRMPRDPNQSATMIVDLATGQAAPEPEGVKDPAAIHRGHLGGIKGGAAQAARMTPAERSESARRAAKARWAKKTG